MNKIQNERSNRNKLSEMSFEIKPAPTDLAENIVNFIEQYDPGFEHADNPEREKSKEQLIDTLTEQLLQDNTERWILRLKELSEISSEVKAKADEIILKISRYEGISPCIAQMPIFEVATLDFVNNPNINGELNRDSSMLEALLHFTLEQEREEFFKNYDEVKMTAALKDSCQPKIAILQLREGEENCERRFISFETMGSVLHEQPDCSNYELIYVRNANEKAKTKQAQQILNNCLYEEFNANTLRPRNYYGYDLSVSDVIVIVNDFNENFSQCYAYYVDSIGFVKLPDNFLSHEMHAKIRNNLDIRREYLLLEHIKEFETKNVLSVMDKATSDRHSQIIREYSDVFELSDRRWIIGDMDSLGYKFVPDDEYSDDFLVWKAKDNENDILSMDGWSCVKDFVSDVHKLIENYSIQQLMARVNGDYSIIEYDMFDYKAVKTALRNSGFYIKGFEVKDMVYVANFIYNGKEMQRVVMSQGGIYYISTGSRQPGDLRRHDFTLEERQAFDSFARANNGQDM